MIFISFLRELKEERNVRYTWKLRDTFAEDMKKKLSEIDPQVSIVVAHNLKLFSLNSRLVRLKKKIRCLVNWSISLIIQDNN